MTPQPPRRGCGRVGPTRGQGSRQPDRSSAPQQTLPAHLCCRANGCLFFRKILIIYEAFSYVWLCRESDAHLGSLEDSRNSGSQPCHPEGTVKQVQCGDGLLTALAVQARRPGLSRGRPRPVLPPETMGRGAWVAILGHVPSRLPWTWASGQLLTAATGPGGQRREESIWGAAPPRLPIGARHGRTASSTARDAGSPRRCGKAAPSLPPEGFLGSMGGARECHLLGGGHGVPAGKWNSRAKSGQTQGRPPWEQGSGPRTQPWPFAAPQPSLNKGWAQSRAPRVVACWPRCILRGRDGSDGSQAQAGVVSVLLTASRPGRGAQMSLRPWLACGRAWATGLVCKPQGSHRTRHLSKPLPPKGRNLARSGRRPDAGTQRHLVGGGGPRRPSAGPG